MADFSSHTEYNQITSVSQLWQTQKWLPQAQRHDKCKRPRLLNLEQKKKRWSNLRMADWRTKKETDNWLSIVSRSLRQGAWFPAIHINKAMLKIKHSPQLFTPRMLKTLQANTHLLLCQRLSCNGTLKEVNILHTNTFYDCCTWDINRISIRNT